jgi:hypothetical protein
MVQTEDGFPVPARPIKVAGSVWRALLVLVAAQALSVPLHAGDTGTVEPTDPTMPASDPSPVPVEYSILWPGLSGKYTVVTLEDALSTVALGGHAGSVRSIELRKTASREGFDPCLNLAQGLEAAFAAAGLTAKVEAVRRAEPGNVQSLSRSDLPPSPQGRYLIDVVIGSIGLAAWSNGSDWEPLFSLKWRVLSPRGDILVPSHVFWHGPVDEKRSGGRTSRTTDCDLPTFKKTMAEPALLWPCFDRAFHNASRDLVQLILATQKRAQSPSQASPP